MPDSVDDSRLPPKRARPTVQARGFALLLIVAAVGCSSGAEEESSALPADALYNSIEAAREAKPAAEAAPERLGILTAGDIPEDLRSGSACRLMQGERLLLHAAAAGAVARVDGRPLRLKIAGPVGPSGGFFAASGVTISVGRQVAPAGEGYEPPAPATASIGNDSDAGRQQVAGIWACLPVPAPLSRKSTGPVR